MRGATAEGFIGRVVGRSNYNGNANGGLAYANANNASSNANRNNGARLAHRTHTPLGNRPYGIPLRDGGEQTDEKPEPQQKRRSPCGKLKNDKKPVETGRETIPTALDRRN